MRLTAINLGRARLTACMVAGAAVLAAAASHAQDRGRLRQPAPPEDQESALPDEELTELEDEQEPDLAPLFMPLEDDEELGPEDGIQERSIFSLTLPDSGSVNALNADALRVTNTGLGLLGSETALHGIVTGAGNAVRGESQQTGAAGSGVHGSHAGSGRGVYGQSAHGMGVYGKTTLSNGTGLSAGVLGETTSPAGYGGIFRGVPGGIGVAGEVNAPGQLSYALKVKNEGSSSGTAVGALFQVDSGGVRGKGAIVYERTNTYNRGDFRILQNSATSTALPILANTVMTIKNNGNVLVGTTASTGARLQVENAGAGLNGATARFNNTSPSGIAINATTNSSDATLVVGNSGGGDLIRGFNGGCCPVFQVRIDGATRVSVLEVTGADLAEKFPASEATRAGMVMEIDPENPGQLRLARDAYSHRVAGVVSGAGDLPPGAILGNLPGSDAAPAIALSGRVWVQCDASAGPIQPGDLLTTAELEGHAMKAADHDRAHGAVLGKAMTSLTEGQGLVLVLVSLQ